MKVIENANVAAKFEIAHPFIAPLQCSFRAPGRLSLLSPIASGGYLFSHIQKKRRFDVNMSKLYAAELLCVLECLHDHGITFACLRPENILVDAFGHISLCRPDLFILDGRKRGHILPGTPEIAAPELLLGQQPSRTMDWWSLGIFLYEMLTGLLPFYHKDPEEQHHRIINQKLTVETLVLSDAAGILTGLLEKDHTKRLGVNGASEVKAHAFFQDIDWDELLRRTCVAYFEPCDTNMVFRSSDLSIKRAETRMQQRVSGIIYQEDIFGDFRWWKVKGPVRDGTSSNMTESIIAEQNDDECEIAWESAPGEFYFHNRTTGEMRQVNEPPANQPLAVQEPQRPPPTAENHFAVTDEVTGFTKCAVPSERQKKSALAAALKLGYSNRVIERLLEYSINLNVGILEYDYAVDLNLIPDKIDGLTVSGYIEHKVMLTPLEWAVEHGNIDPVNLFLDKGADASYTFEIVDGPSLLKAIRKGDQRLVNVLAKRTDRVSSTRALRLAVELRDTTMGKMLLSAGVCCDFERADGSGPTPTFYDCYFGPGELQIWHFINPLTIAARAGDADLVRLLLAYGADANADYHTVTSWDNEHDDRVDTIPVHFYCGRPVQVAMELGHLDVVKVLIEEGGADIWLPHPVSRFPYHTCPIVPRDVYVRVTAELEEVAAVVRLSQQAS
ncbi:kinase-like domain-containing protein [Xylariaceae sp. AK1471]|nr:kinase-like domain-containing protein [Xylariaceae sp. AK1471]